MPSRRPARRERPPLVFFIDRGLGKHAVAAVFRDHGHEVVLMSELYPNGTDQRIEDDQWIAQVSDLGYVALTKDPSIAKDHEEALRASTLRLFALNNANITGEEMAARFEQNYNRIVQRAAHRGPYMDVVGVRLERRWPAP